MHHRSGSCVKGHYRNGTWIAGHNRKSTYVSSHEGTVYSGETFAYSHPVNLDNEYNFLKKYFRLKSTPFSIGIKYVKINNKIKNAISPHLSQLRKKKLESKDSFDFINYLEKYIIDNIESELLGIEDIKSFYTKLNDILQIVYILILCEADPYYKITYTREKEEEKEVVANTLEEIVKLMKNIIQENRVILSNYYNEPDWEYQRNKFFNQKMKNRISNPQIALHMLFKRVCEEMLK